MFELAPDGCSAGAMRTLDEVKKRGEPQWWLWAARCTACGQGWLVASEGRLNDIFCLRRLDDPDLRNLELHDRWPTDFDHYERLLELSREAGHSVRFLDPLSSSLEDTLTLLARQRPGIRTSELAHLLNLDPVLTTELARRATTHSAAQITFDLPPPP